MNQTDMFIDAISRLAHTVAGYNGDCTIDSITVSHELYRRLESECIKTARYLSSDIPKNVSVLGIPINSSPKKCVNHKPIISAIIKSSSIPDVAAYEFKCEICNKFLTATWKEK
jgi:hypothetical protein